MEECPCGRNKSYANCCGLVHRDIRNASTAEDLMRSRYVAFVKGDGEYLMESKHSTTRDLSKKEALVEWANAMEWIGLEVLRTKKGQADDEEGMVEFKAHYKEGRKRRVLQQRGEFRKEYGAWRYVDLV